ncbi:hypothetical protein ACTFIV_008215 [Dictyostelium citrinum]
MSASVSNPVSQFNNISLGGRISGTRGILKFTTNNITWKSESGKSETVSSTDIKKANWTRVTPRIFQLILSIKGGATVKFDGFKEQDYEVVRKFLADQYNVSPLDVVELSSKGCNWGEVKVNGPMIQFTTDHGKVGFEFPISEVSQSVIGANNKNELTLEFHHDKTMDDDDESMVEMRFFTPIRPSKEGEEGKEKKEGKEGEEDEENQDDDDDDEEKEEEISALEQFQQTIMNKSDMVSNVGKSLVVFSAIQFLTPRGRIDIEMYPTFLKLHGKTHDYKVPYESISRLFQFFRPDQKHIFFIISLDPPIRQGQTKYAHLVIQFQAEENIHLELNLTDELQQKFKDQLSPIMNGNANALICKILKALTGKKITIPGNFQSDSGANSIKCSLKANEGYLYPLERCFFFVHKPPTYIKFEDISNIEFSRYGAPSVRGGSNRTFDLSINLKNSTSIQFVNIQREEYPSLFNFLKEKKLSILNPVTTGPAMIIDDDDSDDDDYEPSESGSESDEGSGSDASEEESEEDKKAKKKQKK